MIYNSNTPKSKPIDFDKLRELPGLSMAAFQHPLDEQASIGLQRILFFPQLVEKINSIFSEKALQVSLLANAIQLGPNQGRSVYEKFVKAAKILDLPKLPNLYLSSRQDFNAFASGMENYNIVLCSPLVDALTEEELLAVIAHELGHIKCRHELYVTMVYILKTFGDALISRLLPFGVGAVASISLQLGILQWYRASELSCDRAALLVVQDPHVVASMLSKLAGGSRKILPEINLEGIFEQADKYQDWDDELIEKIIKVHMMLEETHPYPIVRVREIMNWAQSDEYKEIMDGKYQREPSVNTKAPGVTCYKCGETVEATAQFCMSCGSRLRGVCGKCQAPVEMTWKLCPQCENHL